MAPVNFQTQSPTDNSSLKYLAPEDGYKQCLPSIFKGSSIGKCRQDQINNGAPTFPGEITLFGYTESDAKNK